MAGETYGFVETVTVGAGGVSAITFSNITPLSNDIYIFLSARNTTTNEDVNLKINGSSTNADYTYTILQGSASVVTGIGNTAAIPYFKIPGTSHSTSLFGAAKIFIPNYSGSDVKSIAFESSTESFNAQTVFQQMSTATFSQTTAISSITLAPTSGNFDQNTVASLYLVKK